MVPPASTLAHVGAVMKRALSGIWGTVQNDCAAAVPNVSSAPYRALRKVKWIVCTTAARQWSGRLLRCLHLLSSCTWLSARKQRDVRGPTGAPWLIPSDGVLKYLA